MTKTLISHKRNTNALTNTINTLTFKNVHHGHDAISREMSSSCSSSTSLNKSDQSLIIRLPKPQCSRDRHRCLNHANENRESGPYYSVPELLSKLSISPLPSASYADDSFYALSAISNTARSEEFSRASSCKSVKLSSKRNCSCQKQVVCFVRTIIV